MTVIYVREYTKKWKIPRDKNWPEQSTWNIGTWSPLTTWLQQPKHECGQQNRVRHRFYKGSTEVYIKHKPTIIYVFTCNVTMIFLLVIICLGQRILLFISKPPVGWDLKSELIHLYSACLFEMQNTGCHTLFVLRCVRFAPCALINDSNVCFCIYLHLKRNTLIHHSNSLNI